MNNCFAETLRAYRKSAGLTQAGLAERAGVGRETIYKTEAGRGYPRVEVCMAIAEALGCTTSELLGEGSAGDIAALKIANQKLALSLAAVQQAITQLETCSEICAHCVNEWRGETV